MTHPHQSQKRSSLVDAEEDPPFKIAKLLNHEYDEILTSRRPPVIALMIEEYQVKRLLVDNMYRHNILLASTLEKMHQKWDRIEEPIELVLLPKCTTDHVVGKILTVVPRR